MAFGKNWRIPGNNPSEVNRELAKCFDPHAHAITVVSEAHRLIHDAMYFDASGIHTGIADSASLDILFKFPAGSIGHMTVVEFALDDAPCQATLYENVVTSADGTPARIRNHNRVSGSDTSPTTMFTGPTITDIGDILHERYIPSPGATGGQAAGSLVTGEDAEWVLGSPTVATEYMWRMTNNSGGAITIGFHMNGYGLSYEDS